MTPIEELRLLQKLIDKHDLPMSPILKYAIRERENQYEEQMQAHNDKPVVAEPLPSEKKCMNLNAYLEDFANLSVGISKGKKLPHKAILLLGLIHLVQTGEINCNRFKLDSVTADAFNSCWKFYIPQAKVPSVWIPFWHMKNEPFWHFNALNIDKETLLQDIMRYSSNTSIGKLRTIISYAYLDNELFDYIMHERSRQKLKEVLLNTYVL